MMNEQHAEKSGALFASEWYAALGLAYVSGHSNLSAADINFILNGDISPFTRFMFLFASHNAAVAAVTTLGNEDAFRVVTEIHSFVRPRHEFSGRLWMELTILNCVKDSLHSYAIAKLGSTSKQV